MKRPLPAKLPPSQRSAVTNGARILVGVNGCTALARRYRDLVDCLTSEIGEGATEIELLQARAAAGLQLHAEEMSARIIRGEPVNSEEVTRAGNAAIRAVAQLRRRPPKPGRRGGSVAQYLEAKRAGEAGQ